MNDKQNYLRLPFAYTFISIVKLSKVHLNVHQISIIAGCTYSHCYKIFIVLQREGFIKNMFKGRSNRVSITKKGKLLANSIIRIKEMTEND